MRMSDAEFIEAFEELPYGERVNVVGDALASVILSEWETYYGPLVEDRMRLEGLGQVAPAKTPTAADAAGAIIAEQAMKLLAPIMPALGAKLQEVAQPATEKAMSVIMPKLTAQIPLFAVLTGLVAGALVILGLYLGRRVL